MVVEVAVGLGQGGVQVHTVGGLDFRIADRAFHQRQVRVARGIAGAIGQAAVRAAPGRRQLDGARIGRSRVLQVTQGLERDAHGEVSIGMVGLDGERASAVRQRLRRPVQRQEGKAGVAVRLDKAGPQRDGFLMAGKRFGLAVQGGE